MSDQDTADQGDDMAPKKFDVNTDEGKTTLDQIDANIERAKSLVEAENTEGLAQLKEETEELISSLSGQGSIAVKKEKRNAWTAAATAQEKPASKAVAEAPKEGTVQPKTYDQYEGVAELVSLGVEKVSEGIKAHVKTSTLAKEIAALTFDAWLRIPNKDGNPDLRGDSDAAKKASRAMYDQALEGFDDDYDHAEALKKLIRSAQTQRTDVRAAWLRSLDEDTEEAAERIALVEGVLKDAPEGAKLSEFAAAHYRVGLKGELEKSRERYIPRAALESGAGDSDKGEDQAEPVDPNEALTKVVDRLFKEVKGAEPANFENASEDVRKRERERLEKILTAVREMIAATI
ncbi:hypothetical protein ACWGA9_06185 [Streptomyces sp. NPDC054950]